MSETVMAEADAQPVPAQRKTDGQDGAPFMAPAAQNTPGAQNAALAEPAPKPEEGVDPRHPVTARLVVADREAGTVAMADGSPRRKKIAICGFASSTRKYIPFADPEWEIWGLNQLYRHIPRADAWFDIHYNWDKETVPGTDYRGWLRACGMPVYMLAPVDDLPTSLRFPVDAIIRHFGADYFTSTIAYMTALATLEIDRRVSARMQDWLARYVGRGIDLAARGEAAPAAANLLAVQRKMYSEYAIGIFGVDLTVESEYFHEKPCAEFWIGQAIALGIQVGIPGESALCKAVNGRYGYDPARKSLITRQEVASHRAALEAERAEQLKRLYMLEGAIECDERWRQVIELRERGTIVE